MKWNFFTNQIQATFGIKLNFFSIHITLHVSEPNSLATQTVFELVFCITCNVTHNKKQNQHTKLSAGTLETSVQTKL